MSSDALQEDKVRNFTSAEDRFDVNKLLGKASEKGINAAD